MALTSTLFTGLSGLNVNQARLNVVGNNIANVNSVAFKASRALFKPQFYVSDSGGSPPDADFGGTNPSQRGLGAAVASIEKDFSPGSIEPTGKPTDVAVDGAGFFVTQGVADQKFTRDGSFSLNSLNQLVTSSGDFVQGFGTDENGIVIPGTLQNMEIPLGTATSAQATENVTLEGNLNASGPVASGSSIHNSQDLSTIGLGNPAPTTTTLLTDLSNASAPTTALFAVGETYTLSGQKGGRDLADATFEVTATSTVQELLTFFEQGLGVTRTGIAPGELTDDGDPTTPASGGELIAVSATTARLGIIGNMGVDNALDLTASSFVSNTGTSPLIFAEGQDSALNQSNPVGESTHTSFDAYDSLGTPVTIDVTIVLESKSDAGNTWRFFASSSDDTSADLALGTGTLTFDNEGQLSGSTGTTVSVDRTDTGAITPMAISLDFSSMTSLTSARSEMVVTAQDGTRIGTLSAFTIGTDGTVTGSFSNGLSRTLGQLVLATFTNPQGLEDIGGNMYRSGANSGVPIIAGPLSLGSGSLRSGALELSNVDLSKEFINLIIASTGFTASSRVITTSDRLLTELLNSSR